MPLVNGYGVVIGTKHDYFRDPPDNFGRYYHGNLVVHAPLGNYHWATTTARSTSIPRACRTASSGGSSRSALPMSPP